MFTSSNPSCSIGLRSQPTPASAAHGVRWACDAIRVALDRTRGSRECQVAQEAAISIALFTRNVSVMVQSAERVQNFRDDEDDNGLVSI